MCLADLIKPAGAKRVVPEDFEAQRICNSRNSLWHNELRGLTGKGKKLLQLLGRLAILVLGSA